MLGESATICLQIKAKQHCVKSVAHAFNNQRREWLNTQQAGELTSSSSCLASSVLAAKELEFLLLIQKDNLKDNLNKQSRGYSNLLDQMFASNQLDNWLHVDFWLGLCPSFQITTTNNTLRNNTDINHTNQHYRTTSTSLHRTTLQRQGYFQEDNISWASSVADVNTDYRNYEGNDKLMTQLAKCVRSITSAGFPATFIFVFDEYWRIATRLQHMVSDIFGEAALISSAPYAWHLSRNKQRKKRRGFPQHRDWPGTNGTSLNVWVALTESTPKNGCLYCIPRFLDSCQGDEDVVTSNYCHNNRTITSTPGFQLSSVRALPAKPGAIIAWHGDFLHWAGEPEWIADDASCVLSDEIINNDDRIAIAFDFLHQSSQGKHPLTATTLTLNPLTLNLRLRLLLISRSLWRFATHRQPALKIVEAFVILLIESNNNS